MSAADCTKDCTVDCGRCKGDPIGTMKRHIMRQLGFSRSAHGGIPFDQKDAWDYGYLEAKRAVMRVLYPRPSRDPSQPEPSHGSASEVVPSAPSPYGDPLKRPKDAKDAPSGESS